MLSGIGKCGLQVLVYFRNSLIISLTSTVIAIVIGMAGGYAFARTASVPSRHCSWA
jgi:multiple sugar transport system permease protein